MIRIQHAGILFASVAAASLAVGLALADEVTGPAAPGPQKPVKHAYVDSLLGTWNTTATGALEGIGTVTFALGVGDTCLLADGRTDVKDADGKARTNHGHVVFKVSDDGATITGWRIDNFSPEPVKVSGPLSDHGFELASSSPETAMRVAMERTPEGHVMKVFRGDSKEPSITETFRRATAK